MDRISNLVHDISEVKNEIKAFLEKGRNILLAVKQKSQLELKAKEIKRSTRAIEASIIEKSHQILSLKSKIYQIKQVLKERLNLLEDSRNQGKKLAKLYMKTRSSILLKR